VAEKSLLKSRAFLFLIFPVGVFTVFRIRIHVFVWASGSMTFLVWIRRIWIRVFLFSSPTFKTPTRSERKFSSALPDPDQHQNVMDPEV